MIGERLEPLMGPVKTSGNCICNIWSDDNDYNDDGKMKKRLLLQKLYFS
jgi:hypothetical protein